MCIHDILSREVFLKLSWFCLWYDMRYDEIWYDMIWYDHMWCHKNGHWLIYVAVVTYQKLKNLFENRHNIICNIINTYHMVFTHDNVHKIVCTYYMLGACDIQSRRAGPSQVARWRASPPRLLIAGFWLFSAAGTGDRLSSPGPASASGREKLWNHPSSFRVG